MTSGQATPNNLSDGSHTAGWRAWLPSRGNILFVLMVAGAMLLYVRTAGAVPGGAPAAASTSIVPYQGRLTDASGTVLNGSFAMTFKLYNVASNGSALWTETWSAGNSISVTNGLFNVLLGSLTPISPTMFATNSSLWLGIAVGVDSEMTPRVQLGSAPYAFTMPPTTRGITPAVYSDRLYASAGLHRWFDSGQTQVNVAFLVPRDYVSGDLVIRMTLYEHDTGNTGTVKIDRLVYRYPLGSGDPIVIPFVGSPDHNFGLRMRSFAIAAGNFAAGDLIWFREIRNGDDVADTAGRMDIMSIGVEYTGR
jgi:hypothetical protein